MKRAALALLVLAGMLVSRPGLGLAGTRVRPKKLPPKLKVPKGYVQCPKCKNYFTIKETDLLTTINVPEETFCPRCRKPVDPTLNACTTKSCKTGGVVRNVPDFDGPCWRCGGVGICPNCKGSGSGSFSRIQSGIGIGVGSVPGTTWQQTLVMRPSAMSVCPRVTVKW